MPWRVTRSSRICRSAWASPSPWAAAIECTTASSTAASPSASRLSAADRERDLAELERRAQMQQAALAGSDRHTVDRRAVGRAEVLDLQLAAGQQQARMAARNRR